MEKGKKPLLKRTNDFVFKKIFGDYRNADVIRGFLSDMADIPESEYSGIEVVDPFVHPETFKGKEGILDIKLRTKKEYIINVEMQVENQKYMKKRILWYIGRMIGEQLSPGESYGNLRKSVSIVILPKYNIIEDSDYFWHKYKLSDFEHPSVMTHDIEIDTMEIPKMPEESDGTTAWEWGRFFVTQDEKELEKLARGNVAINRAYCILKELSQSERARLQAEYYDKAARDRAAREEFVLDKGRAEGRAEGIELGEKKGRKSEQVQIARNLVGIGLDVKQIAIATGLSIEEIERLR